MQLAIGKKGSLNGAGLPFRHSAFSIILYFAFPRDGFVGQYKNENNEDSKDVFHLVECCE
jgi:hypothetical protein